MNVAQPYKALFIALFGLAACDRVDEMTHARAGDSAVPLVASAEIGQTQPASAMMQPRLIRTATGRLEVRDLDDAVTSLGELVRRVNGVVAQSEVSSDGDIASATFLARIPAESLDSLLGALESLGTVRSMSTSSTDVSREYFDIETRLAVKEASVRRLTQLIDRASRIEDVVAVERELARATTELESLKGQITFFDRSTEQSELRLHLVEAGGGFGSAAMRTMTQAFRNATAVFGESIATVVYFIVFIIPWLALGLILWPIGTRLVKRIRRYRNARHPGGTV